MFTEKDLVFSSLGWAFLAGLLTGLGKLLASDETLTWRLVFGRCIASGTLGLAAASAFLWFPDMPLAALVGLSCALSSLGTSGLEGLVKLWLGKK